MTLKRIFLTFIVEIVLGIIILFSFDSSKWFLLYFFIVFLVSVARQFDYIRKQVRIYQIFNEIKVLTIIRKLKITDDEISIVADSERQKVGEKRWKEIEKELGELLDNN